MSGGLQTKSILKYVFLPGILPRARDLFGSGFSYLAYLLAQIYAIPGLLPAGHPYLLAANIGRFGPHHVIAEAGKNLKFKRENSDQIALFFLTLAGLAMLFLQGIALIFALVSPEAMATPFSAYFGTNPASQPSQDIAFVLLDRVFGVPDIFNSCVTTGVPCYPMRPDFTRDISQALNVPQAPWPFHLALHQVFRIYSMGLLVIGAFILLYYVIAITAETAQTGTPFGKRFNTVWAPIRLVVAIGLLVPLSSGLSASQYIVLYAAKLGSNLATNAWVTFNVTIPQAQADRLASGQGVATPEGDAPKALISYMVLARACQMVHDDIYTQDIANNTFDRVDDDGVMGTCGSEPNKHRDVKPYIVGSATDVPNYKNYGVSKFSSLRGSGGGGGGGGAPLTSYQEALDFSNNGDIVIRIGSRNACTNAAYRGNVIPTCGSITISTKAITEPGAKTIQEGYYNMVNRLWNDTTIEGWARDFIKNNFGHGPTAEQISGNVAFNPTALTNLIYTYKTGHDAATSRGENGAIPAPTANSVDGIIAAGVVAAQDPKNWVFPPELLERGWGGAGIWYNRIAEINGAVVGASRDLPSVRSLPALMSSTARINEANGHTGADAYNPALITTNAQQVFGSDSVTGEERIYYAIYSALHQGEQSASTQEQDNNPLIAAINMLLGTEGLYNLRSPENQNVHPLAQLAAVGKGLVESAVFMLGAGTLGGVGCALGQDMLCSGMSMAFGIATLGLTIGFILFYVVPFLPFVYFFFAVGNWVKGIFEAMAGAPLWALAHLRIDGNGLPGEGAINGYYLIFEIFIRPILILFGFLAAILIFGATASVLNEIWDFVVENVSGGATNPELVSGVQGALEMARGAVDRLFFLVLYAIIMYMMALSSFKLIDMIPNSILRWFGSSVSSFGDFAGDAAQSLTQYAAIGGAMVFQQGVGGVEGAFRGAGDTAKGIQRLQANSQPTPGRGGNIGGGEAPPAGGQGG